MAKLSARDRNDLPKGDFAGPDRNYPIPDRSHAANAFSRVAQYGTSELKAKVTAAVHRKYPDMGQS